MRWLSQLRLRARSLFRKRQADGELSDELQFHLDGRTDELVDEGMTPEQARLVARRELGMLALIEEDCRDARRVSYIEETIRDARYGLRSLTKSPGFATMAIVTLALGIGANTAIFSAVDAVLLRPLPYPAANELVIVWEEATAWGFPRNNPSPANFIDWKEQNRVFADMAAMRNFGANLTGDGDPEAISGRMATSNLFSVLGVRPAIGRTYTADEERTGAKVVVITDGLWRRRYAADPSIVGRTIQMNGEPYAVIGVMPASFAFPDRDNDFFWPLDLVPQRTNRGNHFLTVAARLAPGVSLDLARADMDRICERARSRLSPREHQHRLRRRTASRADRRRRAHVAGRALRRRRLRAADRLRQPREPAPRQGRHAAARNRRAKSTWRQSDAARPPARHRERAARTDRRRGGHRPRTSRHALPRRPRPVLAASHRALRSTSACCSSPAPSRSPPCCSSAPYPRSPARAWTSTTRSSANRAVPSPASPAAPATRSSSPRSRWRLSCSSAPG